MQIPIQNRRKAATWTYQNPVLRQGEWALETDTGLVKVGDGATVWNSLGYGYGGAAPADLSALHARSTLGTILLQRATDGTASTATPTIDCDTVSVYSLTALAADITAVTISGTPHDGQRITVPITDNGTARTIAWGSGFVGRLLLKTSPNYPHVQELVYNATLAKWVGESFSEPTNPWGPRDSGLLGWAYDPVAATGSTITTLGTLYLVKVKVTPGVPISNCHINLATIGASLTNAFMGLYHPTTAAKLGATADLTTAWNSTVGNRTHALAAPVTPTTDSVYVGFYSYGSGATAPTFQRAANNNAVFLGGSAGNYRFCTADTGRTTSLPDPFGTQTASAVAFWVGLS